MEKKNLKSEIYAFIVIILFILIIGSILIFQYAQYAKFRKALSAEQSDICKTPSGYTDKEWREHISHHPDRYAKCLNAKT